MSLTCRSKSDKVLLVDGRHSCASRNFKRGATNGGFDRIIYGGAIGAARLVVGSCELHEAAIPWAEASNLRCCDPSDREV